MCDFTQSLTFMADKQRVNGYSSENYYIKCLVHTGVRRSLDQGQNLHCYLGNLSTQLWPFAFTFVILVMFQLFFSHIKTIRLFSQTIKMQRAYCIIPLPVLICSRRVKCIQAIFYAVGGSYFSTFQKYSFQVNIKINKN